MRNRILAALVTTSFLAAGAAFAADSSSSTAPSTDHTQPAMTAPVSSPATTPSTMASDTMKLSTAKGIVKSFDAKTRTLTLKDDQAFTLDEGLKGTDLKKDQNVALTFKADGQKKIVTQYTIEKAEKAPVQG